MKIQLNTDKNIDAHEDLVAEVEATISQALSHLSGHITRVEVHLSDQNGVKKKGQHDKRCMMEARVEGRQPTAVTCEAATLNQAIAGAADRLKSAVQRTLDQLHAHR